MKCVMSFLFPIVIAISVIFHSCDETGTTSKTSTDSTLMKGTYAYDRQFLRNHTSGVIELVSDDGSSKILVSSEWQGRVMTSTATGDSGTSFGWINYDMLALRQKKKQFNPIGGEERFWIGPEGGQYSFYFRKGDSFNIANWQVPAIIDTIPFIVAEENSIQARLSAQATLENYSGYRFEVSIERQIRLLNRQEISDLLRNNPGESIKAVGYETINKITNAGEHDWTSTTGLMSVWLLGMFTPTTETIVMIPFRPGTNARAQITDNYFGSIPAERLKIMDSILYFTCDGKYRSKIGLSPAIAKPIAASFDFAKNVLTVVIPEVHAEASYVNSKWEIQDQPYKGDVINSYNDGPLADGSQLGPFYEIESSSPALRLKKGMTGSYRQVTLHL